MKKIIFLLAILCSFFNNHAQTIPYNDFLRIVNTNDLQGIVKVINNLDFDLQIIKEINPGEKGINRAGKSVFWGYKCEYNEFTDSWAINDDNFWSYLRLVKVGDINAIWDLTLNTKYSKNYIENFENSLKSNGFKSDIYLDDQANNITTTYEKENFRYLIFIQQTKSFYVISFISLDANL